MRIAIMLLGGAALLACADRKPDAAPDSGAVAMIDSAAPPRLAEAADSASSIATRSVIYIEASEAELDAVWAKYSEEDLNVAGDDFMWYRAQAFEHIERKGWPLRTLTGKRPLTFLVDGQAKLYDLADVTTLDVVILYDTNREPRIIAPIDITEADAYFQ